MTLFRTFIMIFAMLFATALSYAQSDNVAWGTEPSMVSVCKEQMGDLEQLALSSAPGQRFLDRVTLFTNDVSGKQALIISAGEQIFVVDVRCVVGVGGARNGIGGESSGNGGGGSGGRRERWPTTPSGESAKFHREQQQMEVSY